MTRRLTLLFILLLTGCAAVACAVQLWTSMQYGNAMVQRLSGGLAQHIAQRETLLDAQGQVDRTRLKPLFDRLMTFNPSVELYILSPDGQILADAAPPGHIKRQKLAVAPVQQFLSGGMMPVYGDDPRTLTGEKVFSAVPLHQDGVLRGYLYIILQGEELNALAAQLADDLNAGGSMDELGPETLEKAFEICGREYAEDTASSYMSKSFLTAESTSYSEEFVQGVVAAEVGAAGVYDGYSVPMIYQKIANYEDNDDFTANYKTTILSEITSAAFSDKVEEETAAYAVTEDAAAVKTYSPSKIRESV